MFLTQGFAFGPYQIRIATALYALSYPFPFLVVPLALANSMSNVLGGLGVLDIVGGLIVGLITGGAVALVAKLRLPSLLTILPVVLGPALIVPIWLSVITGLPYLALVVNIALGQIIPAVVGYFLIRAISKRKVGFYE